MKKGIRSKKVFQCDKGDQFDESSKTALKTWEEQKITEIMARQSDVDALASMLVFNGL